MSIELSHEWPICKPQEGHDSFLICRAKHAHAEPHTWERYLPIVSDKAETKGYVETNLSLLIIHLMQRAGITKFTVTRQEFTGIMNNPKGLRSSVDSVEGNIQIAIIDNPLKVADPPEPEEYRLTGQCPACHCDLGLVTPGPGQDSKQPEPGDFTICTNCAETLQFTENMGRIVAPPEELLKMTEDEQRTMARVKAKIILLRAILRGHH